MTSPLTAPFVILIDQREKAPFRFTGLFADAAQRNAPLVIPTEFVYLQTGDYSIQGYEDQITVERKSLVDLFGTLGQHRERFEREHQRMAKMHRAIVVVEASWFEVLELPPSHSKLKPKTVFRTAASWFARYGVPWIMMDNRRLAEIYTFRFLEKYWREFCDGETKRQVG